jgi:hypothetical protein
VLYTTPCELFCIKINVALSQSCTSVLAFCDPDWRVSCAMTALARYLSAWQPHFAHLSCHLSNPFITLLGIAAMVEIGHSIHQIRTTTSIGGSDNLVPYRQRPHVGTCWFNVDILLLCQATTDNDRFIFAIVPIVIESLSKTPKFCPINDIVSLQFHEY